MYEDSCPHGYLSGSCAECRAASQAETPGDQFSRYLEQHKGGQRADWNVRRAAALDEAAKLSDYARRSNAQEEQLNEIHAEVSALDTLIADDDVRARSEAISRGMKAMADPANREGPDSGSQLGGRPAAPALVKGLGDRAESAAEIIQRAGNPWAARSAPLDGHTSYGRTEPLSGVISRAHVALEALEPQLTRDGCEKLAQAMAEEVSYPGVMVKRSKEEQAQAAELWLALSNPHYAEAFRSVLRYPG